MASQSEADTKPRQVDLPTEAIKLAQYITKVVRENPKSFILQFEVVVMRTDDGEQWGVTTPSGKAVRIG